MGQAIRSRPKITLLRVKLGGRHVKLDLLPRPSSRPDPFLFLSTCLPAPRPVIKNSLQADFLAPLAHFSKCVSLVARPDAIFGGPEEGDICNLSTLPMYCKSPGGLADGRRYSLPSSIIWPRARLAGRMADMDKRTKGKYGRMWAAYIFFVMSKTLSCE